VDPFALALIGGGAAAFFGAPYVPEQYQAWARWGGVALAAIGVARFVSKLKTAGGLIGVAQDALGIDTAPEVTSDVAVPGGQEVTYAPGVEAPPALGALAAEVGAELIDPAPGGTARRGLFDSTWPAEVEVQNRSDRTRSVFLELVVEYDLTIGDSNVVRSTYGTLTLAPGEVRRVKLTVATGNINTGAWDFWSAWATIYVHIDNRRVSASWAFIS
jgi:hypothetical protein